VAQFAFRFLYVPREICVNKLCIAKRCSVPELLQWNFSGM